MSGPLTYPPITSTVTMGVSRSGYKPMESSSTYSVVSTKTRSGWSLPERFDHLKASGFMPATQYSGSDIQRQLSLGKSTILFGSPIPKTMTHTDHFYCNGNNMFALYDSRAARALEIAKGSANQNLRGQSMSVIEDSFEGRKTFKMVLDGLKTIRNGSRQIRKGDFTGAAATFGVAKPGNVSTRRNFSRNWLEYRYGWMPLLYEIHGALEHLRKDFSTDRVLKVKGTGSVEVEEKATTPYTAGRTGTFDQAHVIFNVRRETTGTFKATVGYTYRITNSFAVQSQSLGLTNPLLTAWELLTLSFVADWFLNVSDVLGQLDAWSGKEFLGGFSTIKYDEVTKRTSELVSVGAGYSGGGFLPAKGVVTSRLISRTPLTQQPSIGLVIRPQLNLKRLIDGAALLKQMSH